MHSPAATAAADPPLDPPGIRSKSRDFGWARNKNFRWKNPWRTRPMFALPAIKNGSPSPQLFLQ